MSDFVKCLPENLIKRYKAWKSTNYQEKKHWYKKIATEGQNPSTMVISCCDSRIHVTSIFGADRGEFFIHRNIANLIPPYNPDGDHHGTSAAIEYAVKILKVSNIIILGHSNCGGIQSSYYLFNQKKQNNNNIFIDKWLGILKPAFDSVINKNKKLPDLKGIADLEKQSIKISLNNLIEFPFVYNSLKKNELSLHGLWHNIGTGELEILDPDSLEFVNI